MTVYAIHAERKYVKVGFTAEETPESRRVALQTGNPLKLEVYNFNEKGTAQDEVRLHQLLGFCKLEGEWFDFESARKTLDNYFEGANLPNFFYGDIARLTLDQVANSLKTQVSVVQSLIDRGEIVAEGDVVRATEFHRFINEAAKACTKEFTGSITEIYGFTS